MPDHYELLGIPRNASIIEIKRAYRRLIRQYHPDVTPQTPETLKKYQELTRAYEVLSDPHERVAYDRKLPKKKYPMPGLPPDALWREAGELVLQKSDRFGPLQQAMRAAVGIVREGNTLIVGMAGQHEYLSGHLETAGNRHFVTECLQEVAGEPIEFRVIEGTTLDDWEVAKQGDEHAMRRAVGRMQAAPAPREAERPAAQPVSSPRAEAGRSSAWDELKERLEAAWNRNVGPTQRQQPVARARFLAEAIPLLRAAEEEALDDDEPEEILQRQLNRAIERVAAAADLPPTLVAWEYLRYRKEREF